MPDSGYTHWVQLDLAIAQILRKYRLSRGLTQRELGYLTGLDPMTISRMERGIRVPSLPSLFLIAKALGQSPSSILSEIENLKPAVALQEDPFPYPKKGKPSAGKSAPATAKKARRP